MDLQTRLYRSLIVEKTNQRGFVLVIGEDDERPARLTGWALDFPRVHTHDGLVECEISWDLAKRLATGNSNRVIY